MIETPAGMWKVVPCGSITIVGTSVSPSDIGCKIRKKGKNTMKSEGEKKGQNFGLNPEDRDFWREAFLLIQNTVLAIHEAKSVEEIVHIVKRAILEIHNVRAVHVVMTDRSLSSPESLTPFILEKLRAKILETGKIVRVETPEALWTAFPLLTRQGSILGILITQTPFITGWLKRIF